jgi:hypothetical protein
MRNSPAPLVPSLLPKGARPESWMNHASKTKLRAMAGGVGLAVFGSAVLVEKLSKRSQGSSKVLMAWNAIAGFAAGWMAMKTIDSARERRKTVSERLKMIGELNHHVRNALQSIQLSAYSTHDQEIIASVGDSVQRIEWALREIVPEH